MEPSPAGDRPTVDYDAELTRYTEVLRRSWAIRADDRVLDIGCGAGQTTREAARIARAGEALGIDVSAGTAPCGPGCCSCGSRWPRWPARTSPAAPSAGWARVRSR